MCSTFSEMDQRSGAGLKSSSQSEKGHTVRKTFVCICEVTGQAFAFLNSHATHVHLFTSPSQLNSL